jgi:pyruvate formate lyase activating enzyme
LKPLFLKYDNHIECTLCPHLCKIVKGKRGICGVRKNTGDKIELMTYGVISGHSLDPVEKKPLYHFFPGHHILSIGSYGCNMRCDFCQNYHISQRSANNFSPDTDPEKLTLEAQNATDNIGLAFTYNEPIIWFEFIVDTAVKIKESGMKTVMVSNGFVNRNPLNDLLKLIDAFNIDLKAFSDSFYTKLTGAELKPVKETLKQISKAGRHLEITTLIIPGRNDSEKEMDLEAQWISEELGNETPLHLSRYFPMYKRDDPVTPESMLKRLYDIASKYLKYVYVGNTSAGTGQDTFCSKCGIIVTKRSGYTTRILNLDREGNCTKCGNRVYRNFIFSSRAKN